MKKITTAVLSATLITMFASMSASAYGLDIFNDYMNEDGTYSYYFDQGITVTMSEEWYQNTIVKAYDNKVIFCHKDSYEKYAEKGIENGGRLFTISYSVNWDFKDLDEMTYIGFDEKESLNYYATKPTDYQAYGPDPEIKAEYDALFNTADEVISNVRINSALVIEERKPSSDLYQVACSSLLSFECPVDWYTEIVGGGIIAAKTEDADMFSVPELMVFPVDFEGGIGDEVVKIKNGYLDTYNKRIAGEPEIITYKVQGTDRKLAGVKVNISSEDGMDTITRMDLLEEIDGHFFEYSCAYISQTYAEEKYEDETTYFEYLHVIDTIESYLF